MGHTEDARDSKGLHWVDLMAQGKGTAAPIRQVPVYGNVQVDRDENAAAILHQKSATLPVIDLVQNKFNVISCQSK